MKNLLIYLSLFSIFFACNRHKDVRTMAKTTIEFENPNRRYHPVTKGAVLSMSYKLFNTGKYPLLISEVQTSCNCVVSEHTTKLIGSGDFGFINLKFDSKKNTGYVKQYVTIVANVDSIFHKSITFETNVVPDSHYKKDYEEVYFSDREINNFSKIYTPLEN